jgi:hypothetical protein
MEFIESERGNQKLNIKLKNICGVAIVLLPLWTLSIYCKIILFKTVVVYVGLSCKLHVNIKFRAWINIKHLICVV